MLNHDKTDVMGGSTLAPTPTCRTTMARRCCTMLKYYPLLNNRGRRRRDENGAEGVLMLELLEGLR